SFKSYDFKIRSGYKFIKKLNLILLNFKNNFSCSYLYINKHILTFNFSLFIIFKFFQLENTNKYKSLKFYGRVIFEIFKSNLCFFFKTNSAYNTYRLFFILAFSNIVS